MLIFDYQKSMYNLHDLDIYAEQHYIIINNDDQIEI